MSGKTSDFIRKDTASLAIWASLGPRGDVLRRPRMAALAMGLRGLRSFRWPRGHDFPVASLAVLYRACPTVSPTSGMDVQIRMFERVALSTMRLLRGWVFFGVLAVKDSLQVCGVHARSIATFVMDVVARRNGTVEMFPYESVNLSSPNCLGHGYDAIPIADRSRENHTVATRSRSSHNAFEHRNSPVYAHDTSLLVVLV